MGRKDSAGNQAGAARMTVGDRFWARRIRPIFDDGDLTLEQKSVFCCIVARDPMSVAIECPARDIAAAEAGLPRRGYVIRDANSFNGVWVNNESVETRRLVSGDVIQIGAFCLVYKEE
mgnify:CR=1 FL=1